MRITITIKPRFSLPVFSVVEAAFEVIGLKLHRGGGL
jgi:hypothetical protein